MTRASARLLLNFVKQVTPSGTINGSNTAFTIPDTPDENDSVVVYKNGLMQRQTDDYTISGTTITFVTAPATASDLRVVYNSKDGE